MRSEWRCVGGLEYLPSREYCDVNYVCLPPLIMLVGMYLSHFRLMMMACLRSGCV